MRLDEYRRQLERNPEYNEAVSGLRLRFWASRTATRFWLHIAEPALVAIVMVYWAAFLVVAAMILIPFVIVGYLLGVGHE